MQQDTLRDDADSLAWVARIRADMFHVLRWGSLLEAAELGVDDYAGRWNAATTQSEYDEGLLSTCVSVVV